MKTSFRYFVLLLSLVIASAHGFAEPPVSYYQSAIGKQKEALKTELKKIVSNCGSVSYKDLYTVYKTSDNRNGKVWDMYSATTNFSFSDNCGSYSREGDCYNREHSVPQSWFGEKSPMVSDAWHVYPTDGYINGKRSNHPFGEVNGGNSSDNGFSKWGPSKTPGFSGTVFEPNDEYKGDFARSYFFFATRYEGNDYGGIFIRNYPNIVKWQLDMLLRWHQLDPVSQKELDRNEAIHKSGQRNRNPYIDYPVLVDLIFGSRQGEAFDPAATNTTYIKQPINNSVVDFGSKPINVATSKDIAVLGVNIESTLTITLIGSNDFSTQQSTITAAQANAGTSIAVQYIPTTDNTQTATLTISGTGVSPVSITLSGTGIDGFAALEPTHITYNSFTANWSKKNGATDYWVSVTTSEINDNQEIIYFDNNFDEKLDTWTYTGYTAIENGDMRLGSSNNFGKAESGAMNLSNKGITVYLKSKQYGSDASTLTVSVDDNTIASIGYTNGNTVESIIPITNGTTSSKIAFSAEKGKRVILESIVIKSGGGSTEVPVEGYPRYVGNITSHNVTGLNKDTQYNYTITPKEGSNLGTPSNTVSVVTNNSSTGDTTLPLDCVLIYSSDNELYVVNAPALSIIELYDLSGRLIGKNTTHQEYENIVIEKEGVYIVRVITPIGVFTKKVSID